MLRLNVRSQAATACCCVMLPSNRSTLHTRLLQLDFWGRSNSLPRAMADCTQVRRCQES